MISWNQFPFALEYWRLRPKVHRTRKGLGRLAYFVQIIQYQCFRIGEAHNRSTGLPRAGVKVNAENIERLIKNGKPALGLPARLIKY